MVQNFRWSATELEKYINCPRQFLYQTLLKFPRKLNSNPKAGLGTALHQALERYFREFIKTNTTPSKNLLLEEFIHAIKGQNIEEKYYEETLEKGKNILENYYEQKILEIKEKKLIAPPLF